jgi:hypothetical protein
MWWAKNESVKRPAVYQRLLCATIHPLKFTKCYASPEAGSYIAHFTGISVPELHQEGNHPTGDGNLSLVSELLGGLLLKRLHTSDP